MLQGEVQNGLWRDAQPLVEVDGVREETGGGLTANPSAGSVCASDPGPTTTNLKPPLRLTALTCPATTSAHPAAWPHTRPGCRPVADQGRASMAGQAAVSAVPARPRLRFDGLASERLRTHGGGAEVWGADAGDAEHPVCRGGVAREEAGVQQVV